MSAAATPVVSFVVPTLDRPALLTQCLDSIAGTVRVPHEVICVHAADDEPTAVLLETRGDSRVRTVVEPGRNGFVRAANAGFRAARGEWLVQLNDDCVLMPLAIENALHFMSAPANRSVGQAAFFHDSPVRRNVQAQITVEDVIYRVCHVRGLCFANFGMVRRALAERLGYYDERLRMYGADPDFSLKVWHEAGLRVEPCPGALVRHVEAEDERGAVDRAGQDADNAVLFAKWGLSAPKGA